MAWIEKGTSNNVYLANMDGSNILLIVPNQHPDDIVFDTHTGRSHYKTSRGKYLCILDSLASQYRKIYYF